MKRWLQRSKAPREVEELLKRAARGTSTEVDECDACGRASFVSQMVDLSTQDRSLLLCQHCYADRQRLRAMEAPHAPTAEYSCICGWPLESPIHERIAST